MRRTNISCILLAAFLGSHAEIRAQDDAEAKAARFVEKAGGTVAREPKLKGNPVVGVNLSAKKVADADLKEIAALAQLQTLDLSFTPITDAGLKDLLRLAQLQSLNLSATKISEAGLK